MAPGEHGASCGHRFTSEASFNQNWINVINQYATNREPSSTRLTGQISGQITSTRSVLRACLGWVCELGISPDMPFYQKKNLALVNGVAFVSLLLALPGTFILILLGFNHPFSLLISGVLAACLILGFNGLQRIEWSKALFAFAPGAIIIVYSLLEISAQGLNQPLNYLLSRQGLCFAMLLPMLIYGCEPLHKVTGVAGLSLLMFLGYEVGSMQLGAFHEENILGISHGLFTLLSLMQYAGLAVCILYLQQFTMQHARLAERTNEKLKSQAIHDSLTGLFNHGFMEQLIGDAINRAKRSQTPLALLMIDVDLFKQINDSLGHNAGDEVLVRLTRLLNHSKRTTDYLGRWGGDELVLLLTDTTLAGADNLAQKLRNLVENQVFPYGKHLTISLGASQYQENDSPASFIARADAAMYQAKRGGRNKVEVQEGSYQQLAISSQHKTDITTEYIENILPTH